MWSSGAGLPGAWFAVPLPLLLRGSAGGTGKEEGGREGEEGGMRGEKG